MGATLERGAAVRGRARRRTSTTVTERCSVLVREPIAEAGVELLRSKFEVDVDADDAARARSSAAYDGIVIRSATKLTADLIEQATRLKVIGRAGVGRRQRRRRGGDAARHRRRERARVDRRLGRGADGRPARRARAQHPAGTCRAEAGPLGAVAVGRRRARRQDARRARVRPHRPAGRPPRGRARHARRRLRPVRRPTIASASSASSTRRRSTTSSRRPTSSRCTRRSPTRRAA